MRIYCFIYRKKTFSEFPCVSIILDHSLPMSLPPRTPPRKSSSIVSKPENLASPIKAYQKSMEAGSKKKFRIEFMSKAFGITYTQQSLPESTPTSKQTSKLLSAVEWTNCINIYENWGIASYCNGKKYGYCIIKKLFSNRTSVDNATLKSFGSKDAKKNG